MKRILRFTLRLPDDLHQELVDWAEREERSLHNLILWLLRQSIQITEDRRDRIKEIR
jgi:predicted HicB family RNase H-like nuclease